MVIDESHVTLPQVLGMYQGDQSRKRNLVDYGFRLPSALDNRPLQSASLDCSIKQYLFRQLQHIESWILCSMMS